MPEREVHMANMEGAGSQFSGEWNQSEIDIGIDIDTDTGIYYKELAHMITDAEKFRMRSWQARDPEESMVSDNPKLGADGTSFGLSSRRGRRPMSQLKGSEAERKDSGSLSISF